MKKYTVIGKQKFKRKSDGSPYVILFLAFEVDKDTGEGIGYTSDLRALMKEDDYDKFNVNDIVSCEYAYNRKGESYIKSVSPAS